MSIGRIITPTDVVGLIDTRLAQKLPYNNLKLECIILSADNNVFIP